LEAPMLKLKAALTQEILARVQDRYDLEISEMEISGTPQQSLGDLSLTFPFRLAKRLKANPRQVAQDLVPLFSGLGGVIKAEVAGPGYINLYLDRQAFFRGKLEKACRSR